MKMLSSLAAVAIAMGVSFTSVQAGASQAVKAKSLDGERTVVIQCGNDPDRVYRCVTTTYDDGSDCVVVDNQFAPRGIWFSSACAY